MNKNLKIILLLTFGQAGPVVLAPAFFVMSKYFNEPVDSIKYVVTLFFLGFALGQLLYGPVAGRFGRRPTFKFGIALSLFGTALSLLASYTHSFSLLLVGRFIEGLGASAAIVMGFTVISDLYTENQAKKLIGLSMLSFALTPAIATLLGGVFVEHFSWQISLWVLLAYGVFVYWYIDDLPETAKRLDKAPWSLKKICLSYLEVCKDKILLICSCLYGLSNAGIYVFTTEGPSLGQNALHISPSEYSSYAGSTFIGTLAGSALTVFLVKYLSTQKTILCTYLAEACAAIVMTYCFYSGFINIFSVFLPIVLWFVSNAILVSNATGLATQKANDKADASAVMSFLNNFVAVLTIVALTIFGAGGSIYILPVGLLVLTGFAGVMVAGLLKLS